MTRLLLVAASALWLALLWAGSAAAFTKQDEVVTMADGTRIATTLTLPDGPAPAAGWPAVMMLHGLSGKRGDLQPIAETRYAPNGYAVLTFDARGHGESGGTVGLDGPEEISDVRALFDRLGARPDVDGAKIGAWGVSYGGGAIMRAAVDGVPFAALEPYETWSDLYGALLPQDFAKSGVVFGFINGITRPSALVTQVKDDALAGRNLAGLRTISAARSSFAGLAQLRTPTFWLQGKRDFAFGMEQAIRAYQRVAGPKRLYLGNLGHAPSTFAADDSAYFLDQGRLWFDRWLKGMPNGIDRRPPVEVAPSPFVEARIGRYAGLPPTRNETWPRPGAPRTLAANGKLQITLPASKAAAETFGSATVSVTASTTGRWPYLVAVLSALTPSGQEVVVSGGGVSTATLRAQTKALRIQLLSTSTPIPSGSRLRITLAAASSAQSPGNLLYLLAAPAGSKITLRNVSLTLPTLRTPVSR